MPNFVEWTENSDYVLHKLKDVPDAVCFKRVEVILFFSLLESIGWPNVATHDVFLFSCTLPRNYPSDSVFRRYVVSLLIRTLMIRTTNDDSIG